MLQQDAYAVDIRCLKLRDALIPVFEEVTGRQIDGTFDDLSREDIRDMSIKLGSEVRKRGFRIMWDPQIIKRV